MTYGINLLSQNPYRWNITNGSMTPEVISLSFNGNAKTYVLQSEVIMIPPQLEFDIVANSYTDTYNPSAFVELLIVLTDGTVYHAAVPFVVSDSGHLIANVFPPTGTYSTFDITIRCMSPMNITSWSLKSIIQDAEKINWLIEDGTSISDFTITDRLITLVAERIEITGYVTFEDLAGTGTTVINGANIITGEITSWNYYERDEEGIPIIDPDTGLPIRTKEGTLLSLVDGHAIFSGEDSYQWLNETYSEHAAYIELKNGLARFRNDDENRSLYVSPNGIATTKDANNASGVIDFFSQMYQDTYRGITIQTKNSPVALRSLENVVFLNPEVDTSDGNLFCVDIGDISAEGRLRYGTGEIINGARTFATGLRFSKDPLNPWVAITGGDGNQLAPVRASNVPSPAAELTLSDTHFTIVDIDGTVKSYSLVKDLSGRITQLSDGTNTIDINWL